MKLNLFDNGAGRVAASLKASNPKEKFAKRGKGSARQAAQTIVKKKAPKARLPQR